MEFAIRMRVLGLVLLFCGGFLSSEILAQDKGEPVVSARFGKGLRFKAPDGSMYLKFAIRFQSLFLGTYDLEANNNAFSPEILVRRARLKFSGFVFKPGFEYKMELGLSNRDIAVQGKSSDYANIVLDAWMRFKLSKNLKLRVGQFKNPGNRERIISSGNLQLVDRSIINSQFNIDRDPGIMFEHKHKLSNAVFKEFLAISSGEGRNRFSNDAGWNYSARVEFLPMGDFQGKGDMIESAMHKEESPRLSIGLSGSYNDDAQRARGQLGNWLYDGRDLISAGADLHFKYQGFSALGEVAMRHTDNPITVDATTTEIEYVYKAKGWTGQAGYMFPGNWEIAARASALYPDTDIQSLTDRQNDYTFGASKFWVDHHLKVQGDLTYSKKSVYVTNRFPSQALIFRLTVNMNF